MMNLILNDKSVISIDGSNMVYAIIVKKEELVDILPLLTQENLSRFEIENDGKIIGTYYKFSLDRIIFGENVILQMKPIGTENDPSVVEHFIVDEVTQDKAAGFDILIGGE